jgi:two-component system, sporulation sensor kinase E
MSRRPENKAIVIISLLTIVAGIMVMTGWLFDIPLLKSIMPGFDAMKFNPALCFVLFGSALLISRCHTGKYSTLSFFILSLLGTLIGLVTLLQDVFHFNTGLDQLFITDNTVKSQFLPFPGRMAFNASVNFSLLGLGFLAVSIKKNSFNILSQFFFHLVTALSSIALIGYLYGVSLFYKLFYITAMPPHTGILFLILSLAASLLNPAFGFTRLFTGIQVGDLMAKRLFTLLILMTILFGLLKDQMQFLKFSSLNISMSIMAICFLLISLIFIWNIANWLNKLDRQRSEAEAEVKLMNIELEKRVEERSAEFQKSEERYHSLIEQASDAIYLIDSNRNFTDVNASMCKMTGYSREELLQMNVTELLDETGLENNPLPPLTTYIGQPASEIKFIRKNGEPIIIEINVKVFPDRRVMVVARDITYRKKMETELREAELKFRTIADKSIVGVYIVQKGNFTYANPRFTQIFGYEPGELTNTVPIETIIHENYRAITTEYVRRRMDGEVESVNYETMGRKKDGTANWVEFYGSRAIIGGEPTIIGSMIDITERKKAEEELRSSEQKYKLLFEKSPMPMWMIAKDDFSIIDVNKAAEKMYGYSKDELQQMTAKSLRHKEDSELQLDGYLKDMEMGSADRIVRHLKKDGTVMFVQLITYDIIFEGRSVRLSLSHDVTERLKAEESLQKSEANLQAILKTTDTAYALFDQDLKVLTFNQKAIEFIKKQYDHSPEKGDRLIDYFPEKEFRELNDFARDVLKGNNINYETDYPQADGSVLWYYVRLFPITNDNKEILGMLMALYDITERKNAEQDLKSAYGRIQNHIDSIKDMAWKQSHLIRSPLANLKGLASILINDNSDTETLEHIQTELDRMDSIIIQMAHEASGHENN